MTESGSRCTWRECDGSISVMQNVKRLQLLEDTPERKKKNGACPQVHSLSLFPHPDLTGRTIKHCDTYHCEAEEGTIRLLNDRRNLWHSCSPCVND